jgi:predicted Na+-dependent transporter
MSIGTLTAPAYLYYMNGLTANTMKISPLLIFHQLMIGVLIPLVVGMALNRILRGRLSRVQPYFTFMGSFGLFMAVYLNVGTAAPLLRHLSFSQIGWAMLIVLAVNLTNFSLGALIGRMFGLGRAHQVTTEFSSGMRSNGTALVVGLASFPTTPLVTVPAAIYIIFQHLVASVVRKRLVARYAEIEGATPAQTMPAGAGPAAASDTPVPSTAPARAA